MAKLVIEGSNAELQKIVKRNRMLEGRKAIKQELTLDKEAPKKAAPKKAARKSPAKKEVK